MVNISPEFFGLFMLFTLIINANVYISQSRHTIKIFKHFIIIVIYLFFKIKCFFKRKVGLRVNFETVQYCSLVSKHYCFF